MSISRQDIERFITELIQIPSTSGEELAAADYLFDKFSQLAIKVEKIPLIDEIKNDPDYSSPIEGITYKGRYNLRISRQGNRPGKTKLFNAHIDVVPPSEGMEQPWAGNVSDGAVYGRGACDDKGSVAAIYAMFRDLEAGGFDFPGEIIAHLVVEEENGGNGSLAMVRKGEQADCCVVLEPTDYKLLSSVRGAVWFAIDFIGKAGHSGQAGKTKSALMMAVEAINILTEYHKKLLASSKGIDLFDKYDNPMPLTFGRLAAGNWPAAAPSKAVLEGVLGFLPNKTKEDISIEMKEAMLKSKLLNEENFKLRFTYKHDCSITDPNGEFPQSVIAAAKDNDIEIKIDAMPASCDAWFYNNQLKIPTVVYGPGTLSVAHSKDEHIKIEQILESAKVLSRFAANY